MLELMVDVWSLLKTATEVQRLTTLQRKMKPLDLKQSKKVNIPFQQKGLIRVHFLLWKINDYAAFNGTSNGELHIKILLVFYAK